MNSNKIQKIEYPKIAPVPEGIHRPFWSVMIPTYNCANYLAQTLESVLAQDPGAEYMQIEVVDDCSTKDDPEAVVKEIGKGRVSFYRQPQNVGVSRNFNTCIQRSVGQIVHILHGDDYIAENFYREFSKIIQIHPDVSFFACRAFLVDEWNELLQLSDRLDDIKQPSDDASSFFYHNSFRTPAIVIRREFYEKFGGFAEELRHTADWEMWVRAIHYSSGISINQPLAYYRFFSSNDTNKLMKTSGNVIEHLLLGNTFLSQYNTFDRDFFKKNTNSVALQQAIKFLQINDDESALNNARVWWSNLNFKDKLKYLFGSFFLIKKSYIYLISKVIMSYF